jgi:hypothetical protein
VSPDGVAGSAPTMTGVLLCTDRKTKPGTGEGNHRLSLVALLSRGRADGISWLVTRWGGEG